MYNVWMTLVFLNLLYALIISQPLALHFLVTYILLAYKMLACTLVMDIEIRWSPPLLVKFSLKITSLVLYISI